MFGAAAARALARRGLAVVGLDRYRPPHELGSSYGGSRLLRRVYSEGGLYVPLVERAASIWRRLESERGERLLLETGGLVLGPLEGPLVAGARRSAAEHELEHELLAPAELERRFPALRPPADLAALFDPAAGVLRAEAAVTALLESAAAAGAELRFGCELEGWREESGGVAARTSSGRLAAGHLVLAAGPWLATLRPQLGLTVERQVQHWFASRGGDLGPGELPPLFWELDEGHCWYAVPDLGAGLKAAFHHGGERTTAEGVRRRVEAAEVEEARAVAARFLRGVGEHLGSAVCLYTNTADLRFVAGPLGGAPRVWVLGGGSGHGFKFAPALGELVADGLTAGRLPDELEPFLPDRPTPGAHSGV